MLVRRAGGVALAALVALAAGSQVFESLRAQAPTSQSSPATRTSTTQAQTASPPPKKAQAPATRAAQTVRAADQGSALGAVTFPNSGAPAAQAAFLRGVAWLHSFGYEDAIDAFQEAQKTDPSFVLAYWGEALSFDQPLWFMEEPGKGRAALGKLGATEAERLAKARTPRERGYLTAIEALYSDGDTRSRHLKYSQAMATLAAAHPGDDEAQVFYALSLLSVLPRGDQSLPLRQKAGAIAEAVFRKNPKHPGAAHYIIHAYDHGALAPKALEAARAYATIAPAASHALHMPAHVFVQLGLWDEAAVTDKASWDASVRWAARRNLPVTARDFHSLTWLHYEWTQLGRFREAAGALALVEDAQRVVKAGDLIGGHHYSDSAIGRGSGLETLRLAHGSMRARYVIESERWSEMKGQASFDGIDELFALGLSAAMLKDRGRVEAAIGELRKASAPGQPAELREQAEIMLHEMQAIHLFAQGRQADAFAEMERATTLQARMPKPIGRPFPVKGADELYAELLLQAGRPQAAIEWFEKTLRRTPNRARAVLGLSRARSDMGDAAGSRKAYEQFLQNWRGADPGLPEVKEARAGVGR